MKKNFIFAYFVFAFFVSVFAEIKVINPIAGTWSNKQMLVIDTSDGADYFYSLNGSDPTVAGFAYDGPVLIDLTGDITVKISRGFSGNELTDISFSVRQEYPSNDDEKNFVYLFSETGLLNYSSGAEIRIPDTMKFSFEQNGDAYIKGRVLKYADNCSLSRVIPCTVTNGELYWRFFIKTNPKSSGTYSRHDLPISINNWNEISFNNKNFIYKIDNEMWSLPKKNAKIDRTKSHIVYWQDIAYEEGNPIEFIVLPPKPKVKKTSKKDGSVIFSLVGDESYSMCFVSGNNSFQDLFSELCADTFYGDYVKAEKKIAIFSNSFYQGTVNVEYEVDKRVAPIPEIIQTKSNNLHDDKAEVQIRSFNNADLYVAVSKPVPWNEDNPIPDVRTDNFKNVGKSKTIVLEAADDYASFYKICAYSKFGSMTSDVVEYSIIVGVNDFYFDPNADAAVANGTKEYPFASFEQGFEIIKQYKSATICLLGILELPKNNIEINFNCKIKGGENGALIFPKDSSLVIKNASVQINDCILISDNTGTISNTASPIFILEDSTLEINNAEISSEGTKNNTMITASDSEIKISNSIISVSANTYASFISQTKSKTEVVSSKIGVVGDTAVAFSVRDSELNLEGSSVRIIGTLGRVCELYDSKAIIKDNEFNGDLKKNNLKTEPIFADKKSDLKSSSNFILGF